MPGLIMPPIRAGRNTKLAVRNQRIIVPQRTLVRPLMAVAPTITTGTASAMTTPQFMAPAYSIGGRNTLHTAASAFAYSRCSPTDVSSALAPVFQNVTVGAGPTYGQASVGVSFMHDGSSFELIMGGNNTFFTIKVDGQYVSYTPTAVPNNGIPNYFKYDFGSTARRRIDVIGYNSIFYGVNINPTDSITAAPIRGPRTIIVGDSFTAGSGASGGCANNFVATFSDAMGWDDVWASGVGGTGYLATNGGLSTTFRARVANDVIANNPEVVIIVGSINDNGQSAAAVGAEATLLYQQLTSALPNAVICAAPNATGGANKWTNNALAVKAAMKAAAAACGVFWLDLMEMSFAGGTQGNSGTIVNTQSAGTTGATGILISFVPVPGSTVEIGIGASLERIQVKSVTHAASNVERIFFDGTLQFTHAGGDPVTQVGGALWTGSGHVGSTTAYGNADLYVNTDGTHPTDAGHTAIGQALAELFCSMLAPN